MECSTPSLLLAGGLAGCAAWIISYPVDVIKTRIQKDGTLHKRKNTILDVRTFGFIHLMHARAQLSL